MKKVAVTGNIGCGKSWVCTLFENLGVPVFHSDEEAKKLYYDPEIKRVMTNHFGVDAYLEDGTLNRRFLSDIIFNDDEARRFVEQTLYPTLNRHFAEWAATKQASYVLYESAIIFEKGLEGMFDAIITVAASEETRLRRVMLRDRCDADSVRSRMSKQWPESEKISRSQYVICHDLDDDGEMLLEQVARVDAALRR